MMERELQDVVASEVGAGANGRFSVHLHLTSPPVRLILLWEIFALHLVRHLLETLASCKTFVGDF